MPIIFYSTEDIAGVNVGRKLVESHGFQEAASLTIKDKTFKNWVSGDIQLVELGNVRLAFDSDWLQDYFYSELFVFASRHKSESEKPCFTVHATGNWAKKSFSKTSARAIKAAFSFLDKHRLDGFDVCLEATHHAPFGLQTPSLFIEIGSSEKEWAHEPAVKTLAECVVHTAQNFFKTLGKTVLGFGGGHYAPAFNDLEKKDYAFGHIAAKHSLDHVDAESVKQAIQATQEPIEGAVIDWKGCNAEQRQKVIAAVEANGLKWEKA